jgi:RNA polymerase sigma-54 factor
MAEKLGLNEATVSRILKDKYLLTPTGLIPLSALFSRSIMGAEGGRVSNKVAMDVMSSMIAEEEDSEKPWSDREIALRLKKRGYPISRRTVTKYRQGLSIGSGADRRATGRMRVRG